MADRSSFDRPPERGSGGAWRMEGVAIRTRLCEGRLMRPTARALVAVAALGLVMGLAAVAIILTSHHMPDRGAYAALNAALGGSFVGTGLYAWRRRPDNRSGALMVWVGFLWFLSPLSFSDNAVAFTVGQFTDPLPIAALAHLMLAVP